MVERDMRDGADQRVDHVGAVEPPAKADLDDGNVDAAGGKVGEGQRRGGFEERGFGALDRRPQVIHPAGDRRFADHHAVDADALAERSQVR